MGPANNLEFLLEILKHKKFSSGPATTELVDSKLINRMKQKKPGVAEAAVAAALALWTDREFYLEKSLHVDRTLFGWTNSALFSFRLSFECQDRIFELFIISKEKGWKVTETGGETVSVLVDKIVGNTAQVKVSKNILFLTFVASPEGDVIYSCKSRQLRFQRIIPGVAQEYQQGTGKITVPMHGKVVDVLVSEGDKVLEGDSLAIHEAMKMQHCIHSDIDGIVKRVTAKPGDQLGAGDLIIELEALS